MARIIAATQWAGAEAAIADPYRLATVMPLLDGASAVLWLMGTANGSEDSVDAVHGPRLESMLEHIVDTPVRGLVYETGGVERPAAEATCARAARTWAMPVEVVDASPGDHEAWLAAASDAVGRVLRA